MKIKKQFTGYDELFTWFYRLERALDSVDTVVVLEMLKDHGNRWLT